jgi:hypothetical protein
MNRQDLKDYKFLKARIDEKMRRYEEEFARATKMTQTIDGMPKAQNKPNYTIEEFLDASNELIMLFNEDLKKQAEIEKQLRAMNNEKYYTILYFRYIENKPLEYVASKIGYSYNETCKFNGEALNEFDKLDELHKKS